MNSTQNANKKFSLKSSWIRIVTNNDDDDNDDNDDDDDKTGAKNNIICLTNKNFFYLTETQKNENTNFSLPVFSVQKKLEWQIFLGFY